MKNTDFWKLLNESFDLKWLLIGTIGAVAGVLYRLHKGLMKSRWEWLYIIFVGGTFAAIFTEPLIGWAESQQYEFAALRRIRDAAALIIGVSGWFLISFLIDDLPPMLKRWLGKNLEFVKEETSTHKKSTNE